MKIRSVLIAAAIGGASIAHAAPSSAGPLPEKVCVSQDAHEVCVHFVPTSSTPQGDGPSSGSTEPTYAPGTVTVDGQVVTP